ncbi:translocation protein Sec62-domain-containing protein [Mycena sanguinolenta]|nr:translocation protein Sec62-domain-containing protein [Mycena sanguinolenta]
MLSAGWIPRPLFHADMEQFQAEQAKAPPNLRKVATFLRSQKAGVKVRVGTLNGKRFEYFKGNSAIEALLASAYAEQEGLVQKITTEAEAVAVLSSLNAFAFFLRVRCSSSSPTILQVIPERQFVADAHYAWFLERSQWMKYTAAVLMVVILAAVRFDLYYLQMAVLGLMGLLFAIALLRLVFHVITRVVASPGIWLFPNLFADVNFVESFTPLYE